LHYYENVYNEGEIHTKSRSYTHEYGDDTIHTTDT